MKIKNKIIALIIMLVLVISCSDKSKDAEYSIAVFIPGFIEGSPTYEMLANGAKKAANEKNAELKIIEGGFNQGEWQDKITSLAASKSYELIISSNPAMPEICSKIAKNYPKQKFLIMDSYLKGNNSISTFRFNQIEQTYLIGYLGGLITKSKMPGISKDLKIGLIAGQEYPVMNQSLRPGFEYGMTAVDPAITLDFRVIGNWYDAEKARELALDMFNNGIDVILTIAGGANQGVIAAAKERNKYVLWIDNNAYSIEAGVIAGCAAIELERAAYEQTIAAINNTLVFGKPYSAGVKEGYVKFISDDSEYLSLIPEEIRIKQKKVVNDLMEGKINFPLTPGINH